MRSSIAALIAACALFAPAAGRAQPVSSLSGPGPDTYLELHLGAWLPQHEDLDVVEPGYAFGAALGARFSPYVAVEGGVGYVRASGKEATTRLTVSDVPVTASLRFRYALRPVELTASAGVGLHFVTRTVEIPDLLGGGTASTSRTAAAFGFQVGAGIGFNLSPTMLVGAGVERSFLEPKLDGQRVGFDALRVALTLSYHF